MDLGVWLGSKTGVMAYQAAVEGKSEPSESDYRNVTKGEEGVSQRIALSPVTSSEAVLVDVELRYSVNGTDLCFSEFAFKARNCQDLWMEGAAPPDYLLVSPPSVTARSRLISATRRGMSWRAWAMKSRSAAGTRTELAPR